MAQKPVANALTLELEPVVESLLAHHLATEEIWFAHDYVPFDRGENFAFLGGRDWVRLGAVEMSLDCLRRYLQNLPIDQRTDFEKS